jgi:hypothetical protein
MLLWADPEVLFIVQRRSDMAEKRSGKKAKSEHLPDTMAVNIQPDAKPDTPSYYINYASVAHSEFDFVVSVLRAPTQLTPEQTKLAEKGNNVSVEPILQLIIPPRLIDGLIMALTAQRERYELEYGPIRNEKK